MSKTDQETDVFHCQRSKHKKTRWLPKQLPFRVEMPPLFWPPWHCFPLKTLTQEMNLNLVIISHLFPLRIGTSKTKQDSSLYNHACNTHTKLMCRSAMETCIGCAVRSLTAVCLAGGAAALPTLMGAVPSSVVPHRSCPTELSSS